MLIFFATLYLSFIVMEVALKLKSDTLQEYQVALLSFKRTKKLLYLLCASVMVTDYVIYLIYLFR